VRARRGRRGRSGMGGGDPRQRHRPRFRESDEAFLTRSLPIQVTVPRGTRCRSPDQSPDRPGASSPSQRRRYAVASASSMRTRSSSRPDLLGNLGLDRPHLDPPLQTALSAPYSLSRSPFQRQTAEVNPITCRTSGREIRTSRLRSAHALPHSRTSVRSAKKMGQIQKSGFWVRARGEAGCIPSPGRDSRPLLERALQPCAALPDGLRDDPDRGR